RSQCRQSEFATLRDCLFQMLRPYVVNQAKPFASAAAARQQVPCVEKATLNTFKRRPRGEVGIGPVSLRFYYKRCNFRRGSVERLRSKLTLPVLRTGWNIGAILDAAPVLGMCPGDFDFLVIVREADILLS